MITALGAEAVYRADLIAKQADLVAALTLEVLQGTPRAFDYGVCIYITHSSVKYVYHASLVIV